MRNKYGQKVTAYLEQANGEHADLNRYIRDALKSQDLEAWKSDPKGLADWLAQGVSNYVRNCDAVIVTWGRTYFPRNTVRIGPSVQNR